MSPSVLIIFAHGEPAASKVNRRLLDAARGLHNTHIHDIGTAYSSMQIDVQHEMGLLAAADRIVFQFPVYWYAAPTVLKAWFDQVCSHIITPSQHNPLRGKAAFGIATAASRLRTRSDQDRDVSAKLFWPISSTCQYLGMRWGSGTVMEELTKASESQWRERSTLYQQLLETIASDEQTT